ncbi:hypothetical protein D3C72_1275490 [compost metagenome]
MTTPDDHAPSLGGHRAAPGAEPEPDPTPTPDADSAEPASSDGTWRFDFSVNFDVNLTKVFDWSWSSDKKAP